MAFATLAVCQPQHKCILKIHHGKARLAFVKLLLSWWNHQYPKYRTWQREDRLTDTSLSCFFSLQKAWTLRSSWKDHQQAHNRVFEEGQAAPNSSTFVFLQVIYQSHFAIQQTGKRIVWINLNKGSKSHSISLAPMHSLWSAYWPK